MSAAVSPSAALERLSLAPWEATAGWRMTVVVCVSPPPSSITNAVTPAATPPPSSAATSKGRTMVFEFGEGGWLMAGRMFLGIAEATLKSI